MRTGTTSTGFAYEIDETTLDNLELVEQLGVLVGDDVSDFARTLALPKTIAMILGAEGKNALYAHLKALNNGRVPIEAANSEIMEIMGADGKN
ncbi:MAG: hypothetical protein J6T26_09860 [Firmicutes bacterium]|nr:hypothetical protein [Bacillota bacterium]